MGGKDEFENSLEFTPTWVMAGVCSIMLGISYGLIKISGSIRKLVREHPNPLIHAVHKTIRAMSEEFAIMAFTSLLLMITQNFFSQICVPASLFHHDLLISCSLAERQVDAHPTTSPCYCKNMVPLLSVEAAHQIHIFVFLLGVVHIVLSFVVFLLGNLRIRLWEKYNIHKREDDHENAMNILARYVKDPCSVPEYFFKQFIGHVKESNYMTLKYGFCMFTDNAEDRHTRFVNKRTYFHPHMTAAHEYYFKQIVGIIWYNWIAAVILLVLNVHGLHAYFWIDFIPVIPLALVIMGTKLEIRVSIIAHTISKTYTRQPRQPIERENLFNLSSFVLHLIHFILFQNAFQIAILLWIWITFGFGSCMMKQLHYPLLRLLFRVLTLGLCGFSTLPLYAIAAQMGANFRPEILQGLVQSSSEE